MIVRATAQSTTWLMLLGLGLIGLVFLLGFSVSSQGVGTAEIEVIPPIPISSDDISIRVFGTWPEFPSGCPPQEAQVSVFGNVVTIDTFGAEICVGFPTVWELAVGVGQLPAGTYGVTVMYHVLPGIPLRTEIGGGVFTVGLCGDQDGDGDVDVFDAIIDLQIIVGLLTPTPTQMFLSDVVRNGAIDVFDVILTLQHIVGSIQIAECGPPPI